MSFCVVSQLSCPVLYHGLCTWQCPMSCCSVKMASHLYTPHMCPRWLLVPIYYNLTPVTSPSLWICPGSYHQSCPFFWPNSSNVQGLILPMFPNLDEQALKTEKVMSPQERGQKHSLQSAFEARRNPRCLFFKLSTHFCWNSRVHQRRPSESCHVERCRMYCLS